MAFQYSGVDLLELMYRRFFHTCLTFYGPRALQLHAVPTAEADEFYHNELGSALTPPTGKERAKNWPGLQTLRELKIQFDDTRRPACDISVSGLGWIAVEPVGKALDTSDDTCGELQLTVHVPKPVEIFIRPPLPVGQAGSEWYEYRELSEQEEELRPKWFF